MGEAQIGRGCGFCHVCGTRLELLDESGAEWCPTCKQWRAYPSHGYLYKPDDEQCPARIKRYCPNAECPSQKRNRKGGASRGRYLGEDGGEHGRHYCPECKVWYAWDGEKLVECGTMILEDCT